MPIKNNQPFQRAADWLRGKKRSGKLLIVSAADSNFFPFVKGLYLSLLACGFPESETDLGFIDVSGDLSVTNWMRNKGIMARCPTEQVICQQTTQPAKSYTRGQSIRPFVPQLFPEYEFFLWIDGDAWVQRRRSIEILMESSRSNPDKVCLCPAVDVAYGKFYANYAEYLQTYFDVYKACYDEHVAKEMYGRAVLSSGVFSMSAKCEIWDAWKVQLRDVYSRDYTHTNGVALHLAEQAALNVAAYRSGLFIPLEATHNFHCHDVALVERDKASGKVVIKSQPFREIGIVHLSDAPGHLPEYLEKRLLWDCGRYLTQIEREHLQLYKRI